MKNIKNIQFTKMVASGNDFIVIDNRKRVFPDKNKTLIQKMCAFHTGIGADGILLLENSKSMDFKMRIFNPDGSEPSMCGNGARCIGLCAWKNRLIPRKYSMETLAGIINAEIISESKVKIYLGSPKEINLNRTIRINNKSVKIHSVNTGVPHAIIFTPNIQQIDVDRIGSFVRWHKMFQPNGTNVDFVKVLGKNRIAVRTYERGVEAETLACGTGSIASAIISALTHKSNPILNVNTKSGDVLTVDTKRVSLAGPAKVVFEGTYTIS